MVAEVQLSLSQQDGEVVARFDGVRPGTHAIGTEDDCDLLVTGAPCPGKLCSVHVAFDRDVHVLSAGVATIRDPAQRHAARQRLPAGGYVDVEDFRLTLLLVPAGAPAAILEPSGSAAPPTVPAPGLVASPRGEPASLEWEAGHQSWRFDLETDSVLVGRGKRTDDERASSKRAFLQLEEAEVSRNHLLVFRTSAGWMIKALDSRNGTWVNGVWLAPGSTRGLELGDLVEVTRAERAPSFLFSSRERALTRPRGAKAYTRLVGRHPKMVEVRRKIELYGANADRDFVVVVLGDSGTGKELAAQAIHAAWCPDKPFLAANCGAITASLIESELFGHEKGAYTGADRRRIGLFESAQGGVVFLDEIGELPATAQVKLLRVLQERKITRVGSNEVLDVHFRLVCATHRDLYGMVQKGAFRLDLYNRIAKGEVLMPSLAERASDIPLLAKTYLEEKRCEITPAALAVLQGQEWPGNVRQLQNALDRSRAEAGRPLIDASDLVVLTEGERRSLTLLEAEAREAAAAAGDAGRVETLEDIDRLQRGICERALRKTGGNKSEAARALKLNVRTFNDWLKAWGI